MKRSQSRENGLGVFVCWPQTGRQRSAQERDLMLFSSSPGFDALSFSSGRRELASSTGIWTVRQVTAVRSGSPTSQHTCHMQMFPSSHLLWQPEACGLSVSVYPPHSPCRLVETVLPRMQQDQRRLTSLSSLQHTI